MDNFEGESKKETSRDDGRQGAGRGHRVWDGLSQNNTTLRRPHCASTGNQPSAESISPITAEHNLKEKKFRLVPLSPQAAEFVPRSYKLPQTSSSQAPVAESNTFPSRQLIHQHAKSSIQDRLKRARETPPSVNVPPSYLRTSDDLMDDNALEEALQLQCNMENSDMGNYDKYTDDRCNLNENKKKEEEQNKEEEAYNFQICQRLNDIINILIVNPAEFTSLIPPFVNKLRWDQNMRCLQAIVTTIIESSIAESNFRYNGARFCKYLDNTLEDCKELFMFSKELFRDLLYFQCRLETRFEEAEWQRQSEEERDQKKCNGLILFLAELVAQMDESYAFTLGELLVWFITKVLQRPASNSVKYICQALKLAGHVLEKDKTMSKDMENMMRVLTELVNNGQVDTHVGNMVNNVHELRKDWGRRVSNCDLSGTSNALSNKVHQQLDQLGASNYNSSDINTESLREVQLDPVMYGPDGEILSAEESKFLQDNIKLDFDQRTSDEEYEDDNYDDEIATAYEEFLKDKSK